MDNAGTHVITFDDFLFTVFSLHLNWRTEYLKFETIARSPKFHRLLTAYREIDATIHDTKRYYAFDKVVNHSIEELAKEYPSEQEPNVVCCNNHMKTVGSSSHRILDCVVSEKVLEDPEKISWDSLSVSSRGLLRSTSGLLLRRNSLASGAASTSGVHTTAASTSFGSSLAFDSSSYTSENRQISSSQQPPGEDIERPSKKQLKEHKPPTSNKEVLFQCASCALEMLLHNELLTHVISALFTDSELELLFYDRSVTVASEPINLFKDPSGLVAFIYCFQHATSSQWGPMSNIASCQNPLSVPNAKPASAVRFSFSLGFTHQAPAAILTMAKDVTLHLGEHLFVQHALIGRRTCVVRGTIASNNPKDCESKANVVTFRFTPKIRTPEGEMPNEILQIANPRLTAKRHDMPEHAWVPKRLPDVSHYKASEPSETPVRLSNFFNPEGGEKQYEGRVLQILVMMELFPVVKLKTSKELVKAIREIFKCYRWLYEHAEVIHRDINLDNVMYRKVTGEDESVIAIRGVLSDYDLSIFFNKSKQESSSKQRTGTRPYMAIDLLQSSPTEHLYRHDLESLLYVFTIIIFRFAEGKEIKNPPFQDWFDLTPKKLQLVKSRFICDPLLETTAQFHELYLLLSKLKDMFKFGYGALATHVQDERRRRRSKTASSHLLPEFDEITLRGHVNFDKFEEVLFEVIEPPMSPISDNEHAEFSMNNSE